VIRNAPAPTGVGPLMNGVALPASLLLIPLVGFRPVTDRRVQGTLRAIEDRLLINSEFVLRYETDNPWAPSG
jgi:GH15 family glucan-1,4-alpha-glucosidase